MGFPAKWRHWIMQCVTTVSYSILINGEPSQPFKPKCGLRQGDPMSPYIFILVMEVLSRMLSKAEADGCIKGIRIARNTPSISHLFFADDSLFFFKATHESCRELRGIIDSFCEASGEAINFDKSSVIFSPNTPMDMKNEFKRILVDGRSSRAYQPLVDKVQQKILSWKHLCLSQDGRLLLINAILAALSANMLSVFMVPKKITRKIDSLLMHYWWSGSSDKRSICWIKRKTLELPKGMGGGGGVGLRSVEKYNKALLVKQAFRVHNSPNLLLSKVMNAAYKRSPIEAAINNSIQSNASWGYRCLGKCSSMIKHGLGKAIFCGNSDIQHDVWFPSGETKCKNATQLRQTGIAQVKDLMRNDARVWNTHLIWKSFEKETTREILSLHIPEDNTDDQIQWVADKKGNPTVKSVYNFLILNHVDYQSIDRHDNIWTKLWQSDLSPKWKVFVWKLMHNALATKDNLRRRGMGGDNVCVLCEHDMESTSHLLREYTVAAHVWRSSSLGVSTITNTHLHFRDWIKNFLNFLWKEDGRTSIRVITFVTILWSIWLHRNSVIFRHSNRNPALILRMAHQFGEQWMNTTPIRNKMKTTRTRDSLIQHDGEGKHVILKGVGNDHEAILVTDGAWKMHKKKKFPVAAAGWVLRKGNIVIAKEGVRVEAMNPSHAEVKAIFMGLSYASQQDIQGVRIYTDCIDAIISIRDFPHCELELVTYSVQ
ncbi:uncharacterized protein [Spinacia oleracea]|uniref:Reverse transcriptase domain-containing protein n=1 Tax=Spinacia oleracea TaxID=3562 RepID=A0ABM3RS16_SPIOL|nr:uncharacterized protein LOC130472026 [Spinacia oleracea]